MTAPWLDLLGLALLILANGALSTSELAIVSARKGRLEARAAEGDRRSRIALELSSDPNRFLSTVQIGITLVGTLAGALGGARLADPLAEAIRPLPMLDRWAGPIALALVVAAITTLTVIFGELVPKRLALAAPERFARLTAPMLRRLSRLAVPLVRLLSASTELVLRLVGVRAVAEPPVTDDDVKQLILQGIEHGVFEPAEHDMIRGVLRLGDRRAGALMTPRGAIVWIDVNDPPEEVLRKVVATPRTCFPVCDGTLDDVLGIVRVKDLLELGLARGPLMLKGRLAVPLFLYEGTRGLKVLDTFRKTGQHFALVLDEYGSVEGVLTLTDLLEAIVGDLPDADAPTPPRARRLPDGSWIVDGMLNLDDVRDRITHRDLPEGDYHTLAGFLITRFGHLPAPAEHLDWSSFRFEVADVSSNRIRTVRVVPLKPGVEDHDPVG